MKKYSFELVEYKGFEQYYVDFEKDKNKNKTGNKNMKELSQDEKELSFLNYSFVFKKTGITSDKEYKNLVKLIEKTT